MIKIKYSKFMSFPFANAMQMLNASKYAYKTSYQLAKIVEIMQKKREEISADYRQIIDRFATKDENGKIVQPNPNEPNSFDIPEDKLEEYKKEEQAFGEREIEIDRTPLHYSDLGNLQLTPNEVQMLSEVVLFEVPVESATPSNVSPLHA